MARPMILIKQSKLDELWYKVAEGVPLCKLIRMHNLKITHPTLSKLIDYVSAADSCTDSKAQKLILASLYPAWLEEYDTDVVKQPSDWRYEGKMPLGKWVQNTWAD